MVPTPCTAAELSRDFQRLHAALVACQGSYHPIAPREHATSIPNTLSELINHVQYHITLCQYLTQIVAAMDITVKDLEKMVHQVDETTVSQQL